MAQGKSQKNLRVAGLMSGTSADGVDVAIVDIRGREVKLLAFDTYPYSASMRRSILALCRPETARVDDICHFNHVLGEVFAEAVIELCEQSGIPLKSLDLIGSHGQTIWHYPHGPRYNGRVIRSTLQIGEPSRIAQRTGIMTVADFRPRDMAAGGEGAPLVPYADYVLFSDRKLCRAVQNIGGIANVTFLPACSDVVSRHRVAGILPARAEGLRPSIRRRDAFDIRRRDARDTKICPDGHTTNQNILAFDTGPGNMVIDGMIRIITDGKRQYDRNGSMAAKGRVHQGLLEEMLRHPFLRRRPPKSTGREQFGQQYCDWLHGEARRRRLSAEDMVATATAFTASAIATAYRRFLPVMPDEMILCGGGAHNATLVRMLQERLAEVRIRSTDEFGISVDAKEAVSFAILAYATIQGIASNVPSVTGADEPVVLGKIVPGRRKQGVNA